MGETLLWLLVIELLGLAALPLASLLFPDWPDRGFFSAKLLGLLIVGYVTWLASMLGLFGFTGPTIVVTGVLLAGASWQALGDRARAAWLSARGLVLGEEALFLAVFALGLAVRAFNASIAGQEKPMDFTFLHALIRTDTLPTEDPWMAGYALPYYYFGYLVNALPAKAAALSPAIAYNLAVATTLAVASLEAFGLIFGLVRRQVSRAAAAVPWALGAVFGLSFLGNLDAAVEILASHGVGDAAWWGGWGIKTIPAAGAAGLLPADGGWWFHAARVIPNIQPDGITEFPYFSFLLGDLHPHYMALPLAVLVVTLAVRQMEPHEPVGEHPHPGAGQQIGAGLCQALVLGAVIPTNTWDVPILWGVVALARLAGASRTEEPLVRAWRREVAPLVAVFGGAVILYFPYFIGYTAQPLGLGLVAQRTPFGSLWVLFGLLLFLPSVVGLVSLAQIGSSAGSGGQAVRPEPVEGSGWFDKLTTNGWLWRLEAFRPHFYLRMSILGGIGIAGLLMVIGEPTIAFLLGLFVVWAGLLWQRIRLGGPGAGEPTALLALVGIGALLVPELIFLQDVFGTRMNTVFKFYYDAWILLALAAPLLARELWRVLRPEAEGARAPRPSRARGPAGRRPASPTSRPGAGLIPSPIAIGAPLIRMVAALGLGVAGALCLGGAIYAPAATYTKSGAFASAPTLDGLALFRAAHPEEMTAIQWLRQTAPQARVVEAVGDDYSEAARFASFTPAVGPMGWVGHELQWRGPIGELERRRGLVSQFYSDPQSPQARDALRQLGMELVIVGDLERQRYGADVGERLDAVLAPAYRIGSTTLYRLSPAAGAP